MTKNEYVKTLIILLDLDKAVESDLNKLSVGTLKVMYEGYIKNAREFQFQNERMNAAEKEVKMWKDIKRERKSAAI